MMPISNVCCFDFKLLPIGAQHMYYNSCANSKCDMEIRCNESLIHCNNKHKFCPFVSGCQIDDAGHSPKLA